MAAGNNFTGNPLWEVHFHPADSDVNRGVPFLGKVVFRADATPVFYEVCVDTDPDPTEDGGGTWQPLGGGVGAYTTWTPTISQGSVLFACTVHYAEARNTGFEAIGRFALTIDSVESGTYPTGADGENILISGFPYAGATGGRGAGSGLFIIGASTFHAFAIGYIISNVASFIPARATSDGGTGVSLGQSTGETLDVGDEIIFQFIYRTA